MNSLFNPTQHATLVAVIDRIIPADDYPSASENHVPAFLARLLTTDLREERDAVIAGLEAIEREADAQYRKPLTTLSEAELDALLSQIDTGKTAIPWPVPAMRWFRRLVDLTQEGYYADPGNGANLDRASWKMVGYDPRRPL